MNSSTVALAILTVVTSVLSCQPALSKPLVKTSEDLHVKDSKTTKFLSLESRAVQTSKGNSRINLFTLEHNLSNRNQYLVQNGQGTVEGSALFPSEYKPALRVCAQATSNAYLMTCIDSPESQNAFSMTLDPGEYYFFSYLNNGRGGAFIFHSIGNAQYGASDAPKAVRVIAGQITRGIVINESSTCEQYSQYCITPPDNRSLVPTSLSNIGDRGLPALQPGIYSRVSNFISVYQQDNRFCYVGTSRNGRLVASIAEDPERPNTYFFDGSSDRRRLIYQIDDMALSYGNSTYERDREALILTFEQFPSDLKECLTSTSSYYEVDGPPRRR